MRQILLGVSGLAAAAICSALSAPDSRAGPAHRELVCSLTPIPGQRDPHATYFVGAALPDTAPAGRGAVRPSDYGGHSGRGEPRAVYGQVVRADTLGGAHARLLTDAFERLASREVVIVPWDYDPACEPTYWSASARWVEPGLVGFYSVRLRPEPQWADGRPTFDAFRAGLQPYPHGPFFRAGYRGTDALRTRPSLDAREMFSFYHSLPTREEREWKGSTALDELRRWERAHPELARKYPADGILRWALGRVPDGG